MSIENGTDIILYINGSRIASLKTNSLSPTRALRDTTTKDSGGWKEQEYGLGEWAMDCDGLVLGSSKNLAQYSENLENAVWVASGCTKTAYYAAGINGAITAGRISNLSSGDYVEQLLDGDVYNTVARLFCFSFSAKGTGNISYSIEDGSASDSDTLTLTSSYQRVYVFMTSSGDSSDIIFKWSYATATSVTIDGIQVEFGNEPTTYKPTGAQYTVLLDAAKNETKATFAQTDRETGDPIISGTGLISNLQITAPLEDNVSFTCSISGDDDLTISTI